MTHWLGQVSSGNYNVFQWYALVVSDPVVGQTSSRVTSTIDASNKPLITNLVIVRTNHD